MLNETICGENRSCRQVMSDAGRLVTLRTWSGFVSPSLSHDDLLCSRDSVLDAVNFTVSFRSLTILQAPAQSLHARGTKF